MFSLKSYAPTLAQYLNLSPDALYERQRSLIRSGLLVAVQGRGPGSGVKISVPAVSLLILSVLATESLAEIGSAVRRLGTARAEKQSCSLTGSIEFGQALEMVLAQTSTARRISMITVVRPAQRAQLVFRSANRKKTEFSSFGEAAHSQHYHMTIEAELPGFAVWCIAEDLNDIADGKSLSAIEQRMTQMRSDSTERYLRFFRGERRS
ncbi:hypothetical protein QA635_18555 [Bradyrhizobium brasilense]|uniref:hypothetical protein n=1 Tax=Bradyrhizobium brasilense TaxID=1419277 RepID=UPI0024B08FFE|nr:hypothetical protein [Bradyrhizobium australafricanum]WFU36298.1 hypothetical protein QA635_18555 [Bradyrhizobium australafricanum]